MLIKANVNLCFDNSHTFDDPRRYKRLNGKLIYLTVIRSDITFIVRVLSKFMHQPRETHLLAVMRVLTYINNYPGKGLVYRQYGHVHIFGYSNSGYACDREDRKPTISYCTFVGGNLVTWRSKMLCLAQVLKLNIELWLIQHARWYD